MNCPVFNKQIQFLLRRQIAVKKFLPNLFSFFRSAGLFGDKGANAAFFQPLGKNFNLSGFTGFFSALKNLRETCYTCYSCYQALVEAQSGVLSSVGSAPRSASEPSTALW